MRHQKISLIFICIALLFILPACEGESEMDVDIEAESGQSLSTCSGCISKIHQKAEVAGSIDVDRLYKSELVQLAGIGLANEAIAEFTPFQNPETQIKSACFGMVFPDFEEMAGKSPSGKSMKAKTMAIAMNTGKALSAQSTPSGGNGIGDQNRKTGEDDSKNDEDYDDNGPPIPPAVLVIEGDLGEGFSLKDFLLSKKPDGLVFVDDRAEIPIGEDGSVTLYVSAGNEVYVMSTDREFHDYARGNIDSSEDVCPHREFWKWIQPADATFKMVMAMNMSMVPEVQTSLASTFEAVPIGFKGTLSLDVYEKKITSYSRTYKGAFEDGDYVKPFMETSFEMDVDALNLKLGDILAFLTEEFKTIAEISPECDNIDAGMEKFGGLETGLECELIDLFHRISFSEMDALYEDSEKTKDVISDYSISDEALQGLRSTLTPEEARCVRDHFRHTDSGEYSFCYENSGPGSNSTSGENGGVGCEDNIDCEEKFASVTECMHVFCDLEYAGGICRFTEKAYATECNDGNPMTTGDICSGGSCQSGNVPGCKENCYDIMYAYYSSLGDGEETASTKANADCGDLPTCGEVQ